MINRDMSLRRIALEIPRSTRIFEKLRIDYCCGGEQTLDEACRSTGLDTNDVIAELETTDGVNNAEIVGRDDVSLPDLIKQILDKHHVYTKNEMERLQPLVLKVISAHGSNHPELLKVRDLFDQLCADLEPHMFKEEGILFPYILALVNAKASQQHTPVAPFGTVKNPVRMMMMEHESAGELLRNLRQVTSDYAVPADACLSFRALYESLEALEKDLHEHIHLENNILFPRAANAESGLD